MARVPPLAKIVDFVRAGYPDGVPRTGYVPLFALLKRRLCDDDLVAVADRICRTGPPILHGEVCAEIRRILGDDPSDDDIARASRYLVDAGWLIVDRTGGVGGSEAQVFSEVCAAAVESIPGADLADVMLVRDGEVVSVGATSELASHLTDLQRQLGEGPCAQAVTDTAVLRTDDFGTDQRWPRYACAALELGVRSCLSYKLYCSGPTAATMNVFGFGAGVWDDDAETVGAVLAVHAATAISASAWGAQLDSPLVSGDRIGQAEGIIMERYGVDDLCAFEMLRRLSKEAGVALVDMAQRVVDTRTPRDGETSAPVTG